MERFNQRSIPCYFRLNCLRRSCPFYHSIEEKEHFKKLDDEKRDQQSKRDVDKFLESLEPLKPSAPLNPPIKVEVSATSSSQEVPNTARMSPTEPGQIDPQPPSEMSGIMYDGLLNLMSDRVTKILNEKLHDQYVAMRPSIERNTEIKEECDDRHSERYSERRSERHSNIEVRPDTPPRDEQHRYPPCESYHDTLYRESIDSRDSNYHDRSPSRKRRSTSGDFCDKRQRTDVLVNYRDKYENELIRVKYYRAIVEIMAKGVYTRATCLSASVMLDLKIVTGYIKTSYCKYSQGGRHPRDTCPYAHDSCEKRLWSDIHRLAASYQ
jgi:hypothetical protein